MLIFSNDASVAYCLTLLLASLLLVFARMLDFLSANLILDSFCLRACFQIYCRFFSSINCLF